LDGRIGIGDAIILRGRVGQLQTALGKAALEKVPVELGARVGTHNIRAAVILDRIILTGVKTTVAAVQGATRAPIIAATATTTARAAGPDGDVQGGGGHGALGLSLGGTGADIRGYRGAGSSAQMTNGSLITMTRIPVNAYIADLIITAVRIPVSTYRLILNGAARVVPRAPGVALIDATRVIHAGTSVTGSHMTGCSVTVTGAPIPIGAPGIPFVLATVPMVVLARVIPDHPGIARRLTPRMAPSVTSLVPSVGTAIAATTGPGTVG